MAAYTVRVIELDSGREHDLPADAVTREVPLQLPAHLAAELSHDPLASRQGGRGPLLPLAFRPRDQVFFVSAERWPELLGKPLTVKRS